MSLPRKRHCVRCHLVYDQGDYATHRLDPLHLAAVAQQQAERGDVLTEQSERWADLERQGVSRAAIALSSGVSRQYVSQVLLRSGRRAYRKKPHCFICNDTYFTPWGEHQGEFEHIERSKLLVERLEWLSKGDNK